MKKSVFSLLLLAAAAMTTVSCSNDNEQVKETSNKVKLSFSAGMPQVLPSSRTEFGNATSNGFKSLWSAYDVINVLDANDQIVGEFASTSNMASEKATFETPMMVNYIEAGIVAYHGSIGTATYNGTTLSGNLVSPQELKKGKFDSKFDVLVSKPVDIDYIFNNNCAIIPLEFARHTGVIDLKVKALAGHEGINGAKINKIEITTGDDRYDFGGKFEITVADGTFGRSTSTWDKSPAEPIKADLTRFATKVGDGNSMFICSLPTEITADKSFTITVNANKDGQDIVLSKTITGRNISVPAGVITGMTVSFEDPANQKGDEEVDTPTDGVAVANDVITIDAGSEDNFNGAHIKKALDAATNRIAITGNISAKGRHMLMKNLSTLKTPIDLDLTNASFKAGSYKYKNEQGKEITVKMEATNVMTDIFKGCQLSSIEIPTDASITTISYHAFENITTLNTLIMPANISTWEGEILIGCNNMKTIYWYHDPSYNGYDLNATAMQGFPTENVDIHIHTNWNFDGYYMPDDSCWFDELWKSVDSTLE